MKPAESRFRRPYGGRLAGEELSAAHRESSHDVRVSLAASRFAHAGPQLFDNFLCRLAGRFSLGHVE